jgi:saccharopine dehydrogenase-like NADP-dependent oxidoreductase
MDEYMDSDMENIVVLGAGQIGRLVAVLLSNIGEFNVTLADCLSVSGELAAVLAATPSIHWQTADLSVSDALRDLMRERKATAVVSCLPYFLNQAVAQVAVEVGCHYFDLTEDRQTAEFMQQLSAQADVALVPQCGVAPGFINYLAHDMMGRFSKLQSTVCAVGALPQSSHHPLAYALNWSVNGLINEYIQPCLAIEQGKLQEVPGLSGLEQLFLGGSEYELFHTSGGLGSLPEFYHGKINHLAYKTIRYPGHAQKMKMLLSQYESDREQLAVHLVNTVPATKQDVVLVYVSVTGEESGRLVEEHFFHSYYPVTINGLTWQAIQMTTASSVCAALSVVLADPALQKGFIKHTDLNFSKIMDSPFGFYLKAGCLSNQSKQHVT